MTINIQFAWIWFLAGGGAGAVAGLFFHRETWLGGYASWPRRMIRLAHIAFFGTGFLNLGFGLTCRALALESGMAAPSGLLIAGAATMPLACYVSAWKPAFRHVFVVPALALILGIALSLWRVLTR